jgi:hypothetical protein
MHPHVVCNGVGTIVDAYPAVDSASLLGGFGTGKSVRRRKSWTGLVLNDPRWERRLSGPMKPLVIPYVRTARCVRAAC